MVRTTESSDDLDRPTPASPPWKTIIVVGAIAVVAALAVYYGINGTGDGEADGDVDGSSAETTQQVNYGMAGPPQDVIVSRAALESTPTPWVLDSPESAVRSYLDWVSYGYRTAQPKFSEPVMSATEAVRVDAYNEYNLQKQRIIDQSLVSITFTEPVIDGSTATISTVEQWTYRYVSISEPGKTIDGPHDANYNVVYTLTLGDTGWIVETVTPERLDATE